MEAKKVTSSHQLPSDGSMAKEDSIREVIAFPKVKDASCLMSEAPNVVDEKQLKELCIKVDLPEETTEEK